MNTRTITTIRSLKKAPLRRTTVMRPGAKKGRKKSLLMRYRKGEAVNER